MSKRCILLPRAHALFSKDQPRRSVPLHPVRNIIMPSFFSSLFSSFHIAPHIHSYDKSRENDMPTNIFKALLADTISTMTTEELRNIILNTPDKDLEAVGAAVLAEKRKKATQINQPGVQVPVENIQGAEEGGAVPKTAKKSKTAKRKVVAKKPTKKISAQKAGPSKRKCKRLYERSR